MTNKQLYEQAKKWIYTAGNYIKEQVNIDQEVETKSHEHDVVTAVDKRVETYLTENIRKTYPNHRIVGEEGFGDHVTDEQGFIWYIDPIDGTKNFIHLKDNFTVSIALVKDGIREMGLIYDVMADILYEAVRGEGAYKNGHKMQTMRPDLVLHDAMFSFGHDLLLSKKKFHADPIIDLTKTIRGTRRIGAATLELMHVAEGKFDGFIAEVLAPWDIAAASVILAELGLHIRRADGQEADLLGPREIVCVKQSIENQVINQLSKWKK